MDTPTPLPVDFESAFEQFDHDREFMNELFSEYASGLPRRMEEIRSALREGSAEQLFKRAHNLKGVSLTFCAQPVAELARQIEEAGRNGDMANMSALVEKLGKEVSRLEEYLASKLPW